MTTEMLTLTLSVDQVRKLEELLEKHAPRETGLYLELLEQGQTIDQKLAAACLAESYLYDDLREAEERREALADADQMRLEAEGEAEREVYEAAKAEVLAEAERCLDMADELEALELDRLAGR